MKDRNKVEARVLELLAEQGWEHIKLSDRIEQDLTLRGDDLWPVIVGMHDELGVDFMPLDYDRFFHGEHYRIRDMVWFLSKKLFGKEITDREECTVSHLVDVAMCGHWFDPPSECLGAK